MSPTRLDVRAYRDGVLAGDRRMIAKTITLLESRRADHVELGQRVLDALAPHSGDSIRVGVTGAPGVGKSTLIETLGLQLIEKGHRLAVLAIDPSSPVSGGSILGDKTRMTRLSQLEQAFIRPSPSGQTLGGVAHRTREALLVCEAAGFEIVLVETVGVGQSETEVASMVDSFAVLLQPGAGDELQGIKRGVLELADVLVVNKADGEQRRAAGRTRAAYAQALELLRPQSEHWHPRVLTVSARTGAGIEELWDVVMEHRRVQERTGLLERRRRRQARAWLWRLLREGLEEVFRSDPAVAAELERAERAVEERLSTAPSAARALLEKFRR
ncbi:MAG: methylmalonyl Co-A mutase-associated GTPase MeaB [Myxococcota bacterium]